MHILITGGTGLIGRELAASFANDGHTVHLLSRNAKAVTDLPRNTHAVQWDGRTAQGWGHLAEGAGAIINLAGESIAGANPLTGRWNAKRKAAMLDSRLQATQAVMEAVLQAKQKPGVVIQSSAVGYYGACGDEVVTEDHPAGKDFLAQVCVAWEAAAAPIAAHGVRLVAIRTGLPLTKKGGALGPLLILFNLMAGGPLGHGRQWWPWLHMADEVAAIKFLMNHPTASGPFNLSAPNPARNADFSRTLGKVMRRPAFMPAPAFALRLAVGEMADALLLSGQRLSPQRLQDLGFAFQFPELEGALRDVVK